VLDIYITNMESELTCVLDISITNMESELTCC
jgi:hypothetical protein